MSNWRGRMQPVDACTCILEDELACELPGGRWLNRLARPLVLRMLDRIFTYRHQVTLAALSGQDGPLESAA